MSCYLILFHAEHREVSDAAYEEGFTALHQYPSNCDFLCLVLCGSVPFSIVGHSVRAAHFDIGPSILTRKEVPFDYMFVITIPGQVIGWGSWDICKSSNREVASGHVDVQCQCLNRIQLRRGPMSSLVETGHPKCSCDIILLKNMYPGYVCDIIRHYVASSSHSFIVQ